jgi:hypothetical protein
VLPWDPEKHLTRLPIQPDDERMLILRMRGSWYGALDLGKWRFAFVFGVADKDANFTAGRRVLQPERGRAHASEGMHALLRKWRVPDSIIDPGRLRRSRRHRELNDASKQLGSPYRVYAIDGELKAKVPASCASKT